MDRATIYRANRGRFACEGFAGVWGELYPDDTGIVSRSLQFLPKMKVVVVAVEKEFDRTMSETISARHLEAGRQRRSISKQRGTAMFPSASSCILETRPRRR